MSQACCRLGRPSTHTHTRTRAWQVASQAVSTMPSILLWPLLPFVLEVGLIIYWVAVTAVLFSAGQPTPHWRQAHATATPLSIRQLALTNSSMPLPPPAAAPSATNMTAEVRVCLCLHVRAAQHPTPAHATNTASAGARAWRARTQEALAACAASADCYVSYDWWVRADCCMCEVPRAVR